MYLHRTPHRSELSKQSQYFYFDPTNNEQRRKTRRLHVVRIAHLQVEIEELPGTDNNIKDDNKIRVIDETQSFETEDIISINDRSTSRNNGRQYRNQ
jgi:hypothetical protein